MAQSTSLFLLFIFLNLYLSIAINSISTNQSISGNKRIISKGGKFELGFFQPGNNNSVQNFYIGIWYKNTPQLTPVWVANRENPVTDLTISKLKISSDGNLVLLDQFKILIWSTNVTFIPKSTVAEILDSGNLILRDGSNPNRVFWQSCDHPTDTWLPGCHLGLNKVTGENIHLTSWKNLYDPAPGLYSLVIESAQFFLKRNDSVVYWTSGIYNSKNFSLAPEHSSEKFDLFEYSSNSTSNYFTYFSQDDSTVRIKLDRTGQLQKLGLDEGSTQWTKLWNFPEFFCDVYAVCGPFGYCIDQGLIMCSCPDGFRTVSSWDWFIGDYSSGCVREGGEQCTTSDEFSEMPGMNVRENPHSIPVNNANDCMLACLKNCSCTAYSYSSSCSLWFGDLFTLQFSYGYNGDTLKLRIGATASMLNNSDNRNNPVIEIVLGATFSFIACLVLGSLLIWRYQRRGLAHNMNMVEGGLVAFRYNDLKQITNGFSERLGGGGFGSVFKGTLPDSTVVAVKKLEGLCQGEKQFRSEVSTIGVVQHVNLVRLYGFCADNKEKLLVYEYMPNGSLDYHLFQSTSMVLNWNIRYRIALGIARGLSYLHAKCRDCIIHCDIKPENILLDALFAPKVADFGLAKIKGHNCSSVLTTMRGTIGYLAPEWISGGLITAKADVYSYGMMLLEIISGRRNTEAMEGGSTTTYFPLLACNKLVEGDVIGLLDSRIEGDANLEEVERALKVACWCIQDYEVSRPSMELVVHILEGNVGVNTPPIPRVFQAVA